MQTGRVHSFESCGTVDGPGIRCVVFLQGCPLRCLYCHNRDTWNFQAGTEFTVPALMQKIRQYKSYMKFSGGGLTVTGGEPLFQPDFVKALFSRCRREGIHTALDTSGYVKLDAVRSTVELADLILLDLKCLDPVIHRRLTGVGVDRILTFARDVSALGTPLWIRHVLLPGWTDQEERLHALGKFIAELPTVETVEILPFHKMGEYKWKELNCDYRLRDVPAPGKKQVRQAVTLLKTYHHNVR